MKLGILFDLDGTLLSTLEDLTDAVNYALSVYGCPQRTLDEVCSFVGNGAKRLIELSLPGQENDPPVDQVLETYQDYYASHCQIKTRPYDGIPQALESVSRHFPIAVVSNKPDPATKPLIRHYFGDHIFALGTRSGCPRKPAPDMLFQAMEAIGVDRCIYVGDSEVDVIAAGNAGVPCLSVTWGFRDKDYLASKGATRFCDRTEDLCAQLLDMAKEMTNGQ